MKEHPVLFSDEMVRAILNKTKCQTRRPVKPQPAGNFYLSGDSIIGGVPARCNSPLIRCPFGESGDTLWVRECWGHTTDYDGDILMDGRRALYRADQETCVFPNRWRPSIHMPRWASRITLEVTGVRVERIRDINNHDCVAEGIRQLGPEHAPGVLRREFQLLWDSIYAKRGLGWDDNPWIFVGEFNSPEVKP